MNQLPLLQTVCVLPAFIASDICAAALLRGELECRAAGRCVPAPQGGFDSSAVRVLEARCLAAMALEVSVGRL